MNESPSTFEDYLVNCQRGAERLSEDKVADLLGKPGWVAASKHHLRRLAFDVEDLAQCLSDAQRFHDQATAIAAKLRLIAAGVPHG